MAATELTDHQLEYLARLCDREGNLTLARWLRAQTFPARGITRPHLRVVTYVPDKSA